MEIDKCKKSIDAIKDQIYEAQRKFIDYNRIRYVTYLITYFMLIMSEQRRCRAGSVNTIELSHF